MAEEQNNEDTVESIGTGNDARLAMLNQINDQNDERGAEDLAIINDDGTTSEFTVKHADGEEEVLVDEAVHEEIIDHDALKLYPIKVNGVERMVTLEELTSRAQKIEAADQYLAEAAKLRNSLQQTSAKAEPVNQKVDDDLALARAIQMGNEEEAVAAIRQIKGRSPSTDEIAKTIDERLTFKEAINKFRTEYKDIIGDNYLNKMALDMDAQMIANGDQRSYYDRYSEIGNNIRTWVGKFKPVDAQIMDKQARKSSAPSVPKTASGKTISGVVEEKEESASDVISGIAKARGGPQWLNANR